MRAFVSPPHVIDQRGTQVCVANRDDGFSIIMPVTGMTNETVLRRMTSYLEDECNCDSSDPLRVCPLHCEVSFV